MPASLACVLPGFVALLLAQPQVEPASPSPAASQPAAGRPAARVPDQADMYRNLLREVERPTRILPTQPPGNAAARDGEAQPAPGQLLLEGEMIVDRPGRLIQIDGRSMFRLNASDTEPSARTMELNKNGLLEALEYEASSGSPEFHITAVVSQYRGANYLTLLKYRRQIPHGNLGP